MIIQCDQCNTKFRLDDAKVPDNGVKVRCAKCKNIFLVQKEVPPEEPDFDLLLSGLGTQIDEGQAGVSDKESEAPSEGGGKEEQVTAEAPETSEKEPDETPAAETAQHGGTEDFGEDFFSSGEEPTPMEVDAPEPGEYQFGEMPSGFEESAGLPEGPGKEREEPTFGEYPFEGGADTTLSAESEPPAPAEAETDEFDFGSFDLGPEETSTTGDGETSGATAGEIDAEGFDFAEEGAAPPEVPEMANPSEHESDNDGEFVFTAAPPREEDSGNGLTEFAVPMTSSESFTTESAGITEGESAEDSAFTEKELPEPAKIVATPVPVVTEPVISFGSSTAADDEELPPLPFPQGKREAPYSLSWLLGLPF